MRRLTQEEFIERLHNLNPTVEVKGYYVNTRTKILVNCSVCGFEWNGNPCDK